MPQGLVITDGHFGENTRESLEKFTDEQGFKGVVFISDASGKASVVSKYDEPLPEIIDRPFATHSVSKVFTGILVSEMMARGVISMEELDLPIQLDDEVRGALPESVQERLKTVTLRQIMRHESGLGDYLDRGPDPSGYGVFGYSKSIADQLAATGSVAPLRRPEDYLPFADPELKPLGEPYYSDLGILLLGLAAQHHYNKGKADHEKKNLDDILKEMVLEPAGIVKFSAARPDDAIWNKDDPIAPHIYGAPACGYWTTIGEMQKFGEHICRRWQDPSFQAVVKECRGEFFDAKANRIEHHGGIVSSHTWFSVDPEAGTIVFSEEHSDRFSKAGAIESPDVYEKAAFFGNRVSRAVNNAVAEFRDRESTRWRDMAAAQRKPALTLQLPAQEALEKIAKDELFSGIVATSNHEAACNLDGVSSKTPFPIHSVGKILSGVLMIEMLAQGIISESDLSAPGIALPDEMAKKLAEKPAISERLSQVSILQAMQHLAGLGDYLGNYTGHLREGGEAKEKMTDMVDFITDEVTEVGKEKYSNNGLLLAGFALQNLYKEKTGQDLSYEEILNKLVIEPSKTAISMTRPDGVHYKAEDAESLPKYPATPAGGHFASADDLLKLGEYLHHRCQDPVFMDGVKKYGKEFYDEDRNAIYHSGYLQGITAEAKSSTAEFGVFLDDGKTMVVLMDRDGSENDRDIGGLTQTHARGFYKELRDAVIEERELVGKTSESWVDKVKTTSVAGYESARY